MKKTVKLLSFLMVVCMLLSSCAQLAEPIADAINNQTPENEILNETTVNTTANGEDNDFADNLSASNQNSEAPKKGSYNEGVALVKYDGEMTDSVLSQFDFVSATALYSGANWYTVELKADADTVETVTYLRELGYFENVDYDYIMGVSAEFESVDVSNNPAHGKQNDTFKAHHIKKGWDYLKKNGYNPGGSSDVVIAVIDTGVDYTHIDLRNNIWVNPAEIPDNGKDDDGNGYIDDLCGWNCVGDNKNPMDDNGHGTHVAGIIAAEDNKEGGVGVAYNCKIMVLKAGNSSGYFTNSDITEAIQYAYMNGADVINMSFGGSNISIAVEEALENAYNTSILVAAAGNSGKCNQPGCLLHEPIGMVEVSYPAALPYVIGVMSTEKDGKHLSSFTNYDHFPYNNFEYEVYAVGEGVYSTWPGNKYATLNGTSMASPMVAGIAALLRSYYFDREMYSTKFIQSQIVNTGTINPHMIIDGEHETDGAHAVADVLESLTKFPKPLVNLYDYYIFDSVEFSDKNNGDGIIDAGETIHLAIELQNRGGVASNIIATLDTTRNRDPDLTDPYFDITTSTISLSNIGTYSVRDGGKIYRDNLVYDVENCFVIIVSEDCPNDYLSAFNVNISYKNGLDDEDTHVYSGEGTAKLSVSNGVKLPSVFTENTTLTAGKKYIVSHDVVIPKNVTVNVDPGVEIQFYENNKAYYNSVYNSPRMIVSGELNFNGTADNMIKIYPSELFDDCVCLITSANFKYTVVTNLGGNASDDDVGSGSYTADHSRFEVNYDTHRKIIVSGNRTSAYTSGLNFISITNSYLRTPSAPSPGSNNTIYAKNAEGCYFELRFGKNGYVHSLNINKGSDNVFVTNRIGTSNSNNPKIIIGEAVNNVFMTANNSISASDCAILAINDPSNTLLDAYSLYYHILIEGFYSNKDDGTPLFDINDKTNVDFYKLWPFVKDVTFTDIDGNEVKTLGVEPFNVKIEFSRPVSADSDMTTLFGSWYPYADYNIKGNFTSDTVWEGTYTLKAFIEDGTQYMTICNISSKDDACKELVKCCGYYSFDFDKAGAMSMNLQANATVNGIELNFVQDDYDTLLGYNVYRSTEKDGNYTKLNPAIILPEELTFLDENAEPGKSYWYTYTVVLTDFTESNPAGKIQATAMDTESPNMYHTPVNQGYMNNNLIISCTASDNVGIESVVLYYRTVGVAEWKSLSMVKKNDKFSAKIYGKDLTLDGLEYYIIATDGINTINKGSSETPYTVVIKDSSEISRKGDVDGDGVVTTKDALMLIQCINGDLILTDDEFRRADLNGNGVLNSSEALRILQYINGNVNSLEM